MESNVDHGKVFGTLLIDLSKAFDCLPLVLFLAKLQASGFDNKLLGLVQDYVSHRKRRAKFEQKLSTWQEILSCVLQGSIFRPIFCQYLLHLDIGNFVEDNTSHSS